MVKAFIKRIASKAFKKELKSLDVLANAYLLMAEKDTGNWQREVNGCAGIVFSKDRAMQLHALLSSYYVYAKNPAPLTILYTTSNQKHEASYQQLAALFADKQVRFVAEQNFKKDLEALLDNETAGSLFFMTDDGVFIDHFDVQQMASFNPFKMVPALTKGLDLTYCYIQNKPQNLPSYLTDIPLPAGMKCWENKNGEGDWAYPLSLDATFYDREEITTLIKLLEYKAPNSLESALNAAYGPVFSLRKGVCYDKVKYVNVVCNVVNTEHANRNTQLHSIESLLQQWENGNRIYFETFAGKNCLEVEKSAFAFVKRK